MEVRMEHTRGRAHQAQVWVDGHLLTVCDGVSTPDRNYHPGELEGVKFSYMNAAGFSWEEAVSENPSRKRQIEHVRGWSYVGYGQVVSIMPVVVDFGLLRMEDANWTTDEELTGKFVQIPIDRLEIAFASEADYPGEIQ